MRDYDRHVFCSDNNFAGWYSLVGLIKIFQFPFWKIHQRFIHVERISWYESFISDGRNFKKISLEICGSWCTRRFESLCRPEKNITPLCIDYLRFLNLASLNFRYETSALRYLKYLERFKYFRKTWYKFTCRPTHFTCIFAH